MLKKKNFIWFQSNNLNEEIVTEIFANTLSNNNKFFIQSLNSENSESNQFLSKFVKNDIGGFKNALIERDKFEKNTVENEASTYL